MARARVYVDIYVDMCREEKWAIWVALLLREEAKGIGCRGTRNAAGGWQRLDDTDR